MLDLKLLNGTLVDGTGSAPRRADLGVRDGRVVTISEPGRISESARETIDASALCVAPGFIDTHTHYDAQAFWEPRLSPSCFHGVTTVIGGFCGFSIAPLSPDSAAYLGPMLARVEGMPLATLQSAVPWDWTSFGSFLDRLEGRIGLNAGFFVGHSAVRRLVMGERALGHWSSWAELERMKLLVGESLRAGALGFSTTVSTSHNDADGNPVPSRHASRDELLALAGVVRDYEGAGLEMVPNLDFDDEMAELLVDMSLAGQRPINWNVLGINGTSPADLARIDKLMSASRLARQRGARVVALVNVTRPSLRINFMSGFVFDTFPDWPALFRLAPAQRIEKLRDPVYRRFLEERATSEAASRLALRARWHTYTIVDVFDAQNKRHEGRKLGEVAQELGKTPFDTLIDLAIAGDLKTSFMIPTPGEDAQTYALRGRIWQEEDIVVGASDAGAHIDMIDTFAFSTQLLQKGVREYGVISLEAAVRLLTSVPAALMGLRERGQVRVGWPADLVLFDPATVACGPVHTRYDLPGTDAGRVYADAIGVHAVLVNGTVIVRDGQHTDAMPGTVLRSGRDTATVPLVAPP
jgi:N-acyl-D-aspartate/D-glutamate deacylase